MAVDASGLARGVCFFGFLSEDTRLDFNVKFSIRPQGGDLLSFSQSLSIPGLPHTLEMPKMYSKTLSEIIREKTAAFEG